MKSTIKVNEDTELATPTIEFPFLAPVRPEIWIDLNGCDQGLHVFGKDENGIWQAWHGDDSRCEPIEFNLAREAA